MKQRGPLMGLDLKTDRDPPIPSQTCYPLRQAASVLQSLHSLFTLYVRG